MNDRLAIRGLGVAAGFGSGGGEALARALAARPGPNATITVPTPAGEAVYPAHLVDVAPVAEYADKRQLRRVDRVAKLVTLAAASALRDAGADAADRSRLGLAAGTGYGGTRTTFEFLDSVLEYGDSGASPMLFSNSGHSGALANATILLGITGPSLTVKQLDLAVPQALLGAWRWLREGRVDAALVGGFDEYIPMLGYCWDRFFGDAARGPMRPLEFDRQSAVVGEGAAFLLLTRADGPPPAYGYLEVAVCGELRAGPPPIPRGAAVVIGADGHRGCGRRYAEALGPDARPAAYAPLYGSLPAGMAFDLAVAACAARAGGLPAPPEGGLSPALPGAIRSELPLGGAPLACLRVDKEGAYAVATVRRPGA